MRKTMTLLCTLAMITCNSPFEPHGSYQTSIAESSALNFPLVVGNQWVYKRYTTDINSQQYYDDTLVVRVTKQDHDTFTIEERLMAHSEDWENRTNAYALHVDGARLIAGDTTGLFSKSLCLGFDCVDTGNADPGTSCHPTRSGYDWEADSVFEYHDRGATPVDGCGGLTIAYTRKAGILWKNDYCGWGISRQWILQR
jgi:hypothetical protein